jgi:Na+:H+ antiporter, NhaA family
VGPVERFLSVETSSGILLLVAAVVALAWANSPWRAQYFATWQTPITMRVGALTFEHDLRFWINEGLMTIFFFVVGLEIRREIHGGELRDLRRAALPAAAALGGMLLPAAIFLVLNLGRPSIKGWGVPMATDIAFAVGALALLGRRVAPALRILLLALAVLDDVGAIVVIALFYSSGLSAAGLFVAAVGAGMVVGLQKVGVRSPWLYVAPAAVIWAGVHSAGIHPALAGVVVGMLTPVRAWYRDGSSGVLPDMNGLANGNAPPSDAHALLRQLDEIAAVRREAISPVERLQHSLHPWVAFVIMPLFALANAGVPLRRAAAEGDGSMVFIAVALGLVVGKPLGIVGFSWVAARLGVTVLPEGVRWRDVLVVGLVAGIGFTMAIFIAQLAFRDGALLESAKLAVLCASAVAAISGLAFGRMVLSNRE